MLKSLPKVLTKRVYFRNFRAFLKANILPVTHRYSKLHDKKV